ncbi:MAG: L,D-transpeptidase [cyanobacterium endosymbiont of Rhopalodia musculus]|uniref:L,D-transpeptidase n=1 Tax=cyanobacterium endosymbiont of Epithemia clementina EcSB TaxID=3034674 RepID=UPI0024804953|nr:L,D-transpeptidase [cyanobacterium endosymbiont of Epithemia clementina EcSB]WGT67789.1 L,D-transpeptidase [cyanobacterium endosymbiont of Epithemia clementina EcSB]
MKFKQLSISLALAGGSLFIPASLINKQVGADEGAALSKAETTKTSTFSITPAILEEASPMDKTTPVEIKVLATRLVLKLKERKVYAYQDDQLLASYLVAIGKKGWETPQGKFEITQMIKNPKWENPWNGKISAPGPNSPLGERWIGFWTNGKDYIGFHGTPGEHLIGQAVSHGCVRMRNADVKALFKLVDKGIPVIVQP